MTIDGRCDEMQPQTCTQGLYNEKWVKVRVRHQREDKLGMIHYVYLPLKAANRAAKSS